MAATDSPTPELLSTMSGGTPNPEQCNQAAKSLEVEPHVTDPVHLEIYVGDRSTTPTVNLQPPSQISTTPTSASDKDCQAPAPLEAEQSTSHGEKDPKSSSGDSRPVTPSSSSRPSSPPIPNRIAMPTLTTDLGDITLHSPSSQIIGTPFATNTTRFEYPFPDSNSDPSSTSTSPFTSAHVSPIASAISQPPVSSGSSFPLLSTSPPVVQAPPPIAYPVHGESGSPPSFSPIHPKLKHVIPPMPPSLIKKRPKWSLGLLGRRRSSQGSHSSGGDSQDTSASIDSILGGAQRSPPLPSSTEEREAKG